MSLGPDPLLTSRVGQALGEIADPCLAAAGIDGSITALGLIQGLSATADGAVEVTVSLTEMGCAFTHHLIDRITTVTESVEGVTSAAVRPVWTWTSEQISPDLGQRLQEASGELRRLPVVTTGANRSHPD